MATERLPALEDPTVDGPALPEANPCLECGGKCCSFRSMAISFTAVPDVYTALEPDEKAHAVLMRSDMEQLLTEDGEPIDAEWYLETYTLESLVFDCNHLTEDGLCGIYDSRPDMCQSFKCDVLEGRMSLSDYIRDYGRDPKEIDESKYIDVTDTVNEVLEEYKYL